MFVLVHDSKVFKEREITMTENEVPVAATVAIIGSSRFKNFHLGHMQRFTLQGKIVLVTGFWHHVDNCPITDEQKRMLDRLTLAKITKADEVFVVNVNGYVGESTKGFIAFAKSLGKKVSYSDDESREW